jgi:hypothetical protein
MASPVFFLQSLLCLAAASQFFLLSKLTVFFCTSPSHIFLGFPTGILPLKLPSNIRFGVIFIEHPYYLPSPL